MLVFFVAIDMTRVAILSARFLAGALASGGVIRVVARIYPVLVRDFTGG
jgi:hypothetical protein